jgi:hypothetical protein
VHRPRVLPAAATIIGEKMLTLKEKQEFSSEYRTRMPMSKCICNHTGDGKNSQHTDSPASGHGRCLVKGCACSKFTWGGWTIEFLVAMQNWETNRKWSE